MNGNIIEGQEGQGEGGQSEGGQSIDTIDFTTILNSLNDEGEGEGEGEDGEKGGQTPQAAITPEMLQAYLDKTTAPVENPDVSALMEKVAALEEELQGMKGAVTTHGDRLVIADIDKEEDALINDPDYSNPLISDIMNFETLLPEIRKIENELPKEEERYLFPEEALAKVVIRPLVKALIKAREAEKNRKMLLGDIDESDNTFAPAINTETSESADAAVRKIASSFM